MQIIVSAFCNGRRIGMYYDKGIYNYYARKYPEEILGDCIFIEIPMMDGCELLDIHYINPRKTEGFKYRENWLLKLIYLIKPINDCIKE